MLRSLRVLTVLLKPLSKSGAKRRVPFYTVFRGIYPGGFRDVSLSKEAVGRRRRPLRATEETAGFEQELSGRKRAFRRAPTESSWGRRSRPIADPATIACKKQRTSPESWFRSYEVQPACELVALQLQIIELDRGRPSEQRHRHSYLALVREHFFDRSIEVSERTFSDRDSLTNEEWNLFLRSFGL